MKARWPGAVAVLVEDKANGPAIIETLTKEIPGVIAVDPEGGKVARAYAIQPEQEAGNIHLPDPTIAPWVGEFVAECSSFPRGANDDEVDQMTQAINYLRNRAQPGFAFA
jgi:predicted phage terminase large subunit-like protein